MVMVTITSGYQALAACFIATFVTHTSLMRQGKDCYCSFLQMRRPRGLSEVTQPVSGEPGLAASCAVLLQHVFPTGLCHLPGH